jgi:acyl carrier protein
MDKLELFNKIADVVKENSVIKYTHIATLEMPWAETNLDSMDAIMMSVYLSEIYHVDEEVSKQFTFTTPKELMELIETHKTVEPESIDEAIQAVI